MPASSKASQTCQTRPQRRNKPDQSKPKFQGTYENFGTDFVRINGKEGTADQCPYCGKEKFTVNLETGQFRCFSENTCGQTGNATTFIRHCYEQAKSSTTDKEYRTLKAVRDLSLQTLKRHGLAYHAARSEWLVPFRNSEGSVVTLLRYNPKTNQKLNLGGFPQYLYGVDQLSDDPTRTLFLVEGPFDAMALDAFIRIKKNHNKYDVLAVPSASTFKDEWSAFLRERKEVRVCFDNDSAGVNAQQRVVSKCRENGVTGTLKILEWPDSFPDKYDIADLIRDKESVVEFTRLHCKEARAAKPLRLTRGDQIVPEKVDWLWPGRMPFGRFVSLSGPNGSQKSTIAKDFIARGTAGKPMPGCTDHCEPFDCILFTSEDSQANAIKLIELHGGDRARVYIHDIAESAEFIDVAKSVANVEAAIREHNVRLVVLDALNSFIGGDISTDSKARRTVSSPLAKLARRTGATIIGIRNWGRSEAESASNKSLGSHSLSDVARVVLNTQIVPETDESPEKTLLVWEKLSDGKQPEPLEYTTRDLSDGKPENAYHRQIVWNEERNKKIVDELRKRPVKKGVRKRRQKG
jgi:hypothetical protein